MIDNSKIAILTTVCNWELYKKTSIHFPNEIKRFTIDGTKGLYGIESLFFMMRKLKNIEIDFLIMADEDVLIYDEKGVYEIIENMIENDYLVSGIRDGGQITHRNHNPYCINTFFSILNIKSLKLIWDEKEIKRNQYVVENEFSEDLSHLKEDYDTMSLFEPYYCFYLWLKRKNKKILYLDATTLASDNITTQLFTSDNKLFLQHTWYARAYGKNEKQTNRINSLLNSLPKSETKYSKPNLWKDNLFPFKRILKKVIKKIFSK